MKPKVLFCASEVAPFAKTGGLADVAGSLPQALGKLGVEMLVTMPRYRGVPEGEQAIAPGVRVRFVEHEEYFNRSALYGNELGDYADNLERFAFFCNRSLEIAKETGFRPDVVHAHDWQTALLPVFLKTRLAQDPFFARTKTLYTIHNLAYQGVFASKHFPELGLDPALFNMDGLEFYGKINLMKGGLLYADAVSTVSPTYAREIQSNEFGCGLEGVTRRRAEALRGILNGLDYAHWDPSADPDIAEAYSASKPAGKTACKADLQRTCGLEENPAAPVFGIVSRLADQKGLDLLSDVCDKILKAGAQFVLLGDGDPAYRTTYKNVAARHPRKASVTIGFSGPLSRKIYAGSDFFLMPSYFEPCGLGQLISLRYGTLPIVRETGGLADTITDADKNDETGNGFSFKERTPDALWKACERALRCWADKKRMALLVKRAMKADFSWKRSAAEYRDFYSSMLGRPAAEAA